MSQSFSKKALLAFFLFNFLAKSTETEQQVFQCAPQALDTLCSNQSPKSVCAVDDDNQYLTFKSACQACGHDDTVSYTEGPCECPQTPCSQNQTCQDGRCVNFEALTTKQLVQIARKLIQKQKHADAIKYIERVIQQRPTDSYPLYLGAIAAFGDQKHEQSLRYIRKAIGIDPSFADYYIIRGRAFHGIKQYEEAEKQFQKALGMGYDDIGLVSFYQAQNFLSSKQTELAIKKFEEALKYHPQNTSWYVRKALAHAINKQQRMAVITCKEGLKIDPDNTEIREFMEQFEVMHEDKQQDLEDLQERNLQSRNDTKGPDPQYINKFIQEKEEQQQFEFDRKRLEEKKKKQKEEQERKAALQQIEL